jgi:excisionase family DNA binding protein
MLDTDNWLTYQQAAERLGVSRHAVRRLIQNGHLTILEVPSTHPKILLADVERIFRASVQPARHREFRLS